MPFRDKKNLRSKSAGVTLVEVLLSIGLTAVVATGVSSLLSRKLHFMKELQSNLRMRSIGQKIEKSLTDNRVLQAILSNSDPGNMTLRNCITNPPASGTLCTSTDPQKQVTFNLFFGALRIAGTKTNPARYKLLDGSLCTPTTLRPAECNIEARAYFWASCPQTSSWWDTQSSNTDGSVAPPTSGTPLSMLASSCPVAQSIHLRYQLRYTPTNPPASGTKVESVTQYPKDSYFWVNGLNNTDTTALGAISVPVSSFSTPQSFSDCPPNFSMTSIDNGHPVCECLSPFKLGSTCSYTKFIAGVTNEICSCTEPYTKCAPDTRYRGTCPDGSVRCCPVNCATRRGITWTNDGSSAGSCPVGSWIEAIQPEAFTLGETQNKKQAGCKVIDECPMGKWGGTCNGRVKCKETFTCCNETSDCSSACP